MTNAREQTDLTRSRAALEGGLPRVREIVSHARSMSDPAKRKTYLDTVCGPDSALRPEVERLLAEIEAADAFSGVRFEGSDPENVHGLVGTVIGRYRVLEFLGEGGFGEVYRVEQTEPLHRDLALKVIKPGMDSREVIARFEAERQALAMMDHPNVAQVYDAGTTEQGRPYFAMELAKGTPITVFCDDHRVSIDERLRLFRQVCEGVQHAHQKGLIHRDLKPSNLVVVRETPTAPPVPKIIDFGIAKSLQGNLTDLTLVTRTAMFLGTPAYMSPEQVEFGGEHQDTRTDVYALGVVLYELLAGARPFDPRSLEKLSFEEICRAIREIEPPRPSAHLRSLDDEVLETVAGQRATDPAALERMMRGDLDWIVMKAMEKDRNRRYPSVSDLAQDIDRYLGHLPISARPPSRPYRLRKYVHRHRIGAVATTMVMAALVTGLALAATGFRRAVREEQLADESRGRAQEMAAFLIEKLHPELLAAGRRDAVIESAEAAAHYYAALPEELRNVSTLRQHARALEALAEAYGRMSFIGDAHEPDQWAALKEAGKLWRRVARADPNDGEAAARGIRPDFWERYEAVFVTWNSVEFATSMGPGRDKMEELASLCLDRIRTLHRRFPDTPAVQLELSHMLRDLSLELFGPDPVATGEEACQLLREMIAADPGNDALRMDLANTLVSVGIACSRTGNPETAVERNKEALAVAEQLLSKDPTNRQFLDLASYVGEFLIGNTFRAYRERQAGILESVHKTRGFLATALTLDPNDSLLLYRDAKVLDYEARLQVAQRRYLEARDSYALALARLDSLTTEVEYIHVRRSRWITMDGAVAARMGAVEDAWARLEEYRRVFPDPGARDVDRPAWLHRQCGILLPLHAWPELETLARDLITEIENPTEEMIGHHLDESLMVPVGHFYLGSALLGQGHSAEGQAHLERGVDLYRSGANINTAGDGKIEFVWQATESLGTLLLKNGDRDRAFEIVQWVWGERERWVQAGALLESRIAAARCSFLLAQALDPTDPNSTARRVEVLHRAAELLDDAEAVPVLTAEEQRIRAEVDIALKRISGDLARRYK